MDDDTTSRIAALRLMADADDCVSKVVGLFQAAYWSMSGMDGRSTSYRAVRDTLVKFQKKLLKQGSPELMMAALSCYTEVRDAFSDPSAVFTNEENILQSRRALQNMFQNVVCVYHDDIIKLVRSLYEEEKPLTKVPIYLRTLEHNIYTGSIFEGSWMVRFLTEEELEIDQMCLIAEIRHDVSSDIIDWSHSPPGFCRLRMSDDLQSKINLRYQYVKGLQKIFRPEQEYVSGREVKQRFLEWYEKTYEFPGPAVPDPDTEDSRDAGLSAMRPPIQADVDAAPAFRIIGRSFLGHRHQETLVTVRPDYDLRFVADLVPCVKLQEWPEVAREWKDRERLWPPIDVVDEIVEAGCHMVVKSSERRDDGAGATSGDYEWRLSFSIAEYRLAELRPTHQSFVYFIFKYLFYLKLKPLEHGGTRLSSYIIKTVMMWAMEEVNPGEWGNDGSDPLPDLTLLLVKLATYLEAKTVPNYFIRDANLLQNVPDELLSEASERAHQMAADPLSFIPNEVPNPPDLVMKIVRGLW